MRRLRRLLLLTITASCLSAALPAAPSDASAAAPGDVARALRRQLLHLTIAQTRTVQRRIHVRADGDWGTATVTAMRRWQRAHGVAVTGAANVETLRAMGLEVASRFEAQLWAARAARRRTASGSPAPDAAIGTASAAVPASGAAAAALQAARSALGVPYRAAGTTPAGFDCSGLVRWAYRRAGVHLPRRSYEQYRRGWAITKGALRPGDLVFFDAAGPGASHVAIALSPATAISSTSSSGVSVHDISRGYWARHYVGARRLAR